MSGVVVWLTGLPSSGKSTLAMAVDQALRGEGVASCILDSDDLRAALVPAPSYSDADRDDFYRTLANLAAMLARQGLVVLVPATAHRRAWRDRARDLAPAFVEVHVATPAAECARRDAKGLYAQARSGALTGLPGAGETYQTPETPEVTAPSGLSPEAVSATVEAIQAAHRAR